MADSGVLRRDQYTGGLRYTQSQLWLDEAESDTSLGDREASLVAMRHAVDASRSRWDAVQSVSNKEWLANMHGWRAELALSLDRFDEAVSSYDSSIDTWHGLVAVGRLRADTSWISDGLTAIGNRLIGQAHAWLGLKRKPEAVAAAHAAEDTLATLIRTQGSFANMGAMAAVEDSVAMIYHLAGQVERADTAQHREYMLDSAVAYLPTSTPAQVRHFYDALNRLVSVSMSWSAADTAGRDSAARLARLRVVAYDARRYREQQVLVSRYFMKTAYTRSRSRADSQNVARYEATTLGTDLGNLSWQELLAGDGQSALGHAREGISLAPSETFILVNEFNAMVVSGLPDEAAAFFRSNAGRLVEATPIAFPCAVDRDMAELYARGVAQPAQRAVVSDLVAPYRARCPR